MIHLLQPQRIGFRHVVTDQRNPIRLPLNVDDGSLTYPYDEGRLVLQDLVLDYRYKSGSTLIGDTASYSMTVGYDTDGSLKSQSFLTGNFTHNAGYSYDRLGRLSSESLWMAYTDSKSTVASVSKSYTYSSASGSSSLQVASVTYDYHAGNDETWSYTYDNAGRITAISINGVLQYSYEYDDLGQLTRENNKVSDETYVYTYDNAGNILLKNTYSYTEGTLPATLVASVDYTYDDADGRGDLLTEYEGYTITYDDAGNINLYCINDAAAYLTWTQGRRLEQIFGFAVSDMSFTYNDEGIRTSKTADGIVHTYALMGNTILSESWTENNVEHLLVYLYDAKGSPIGMRYRNSSYPMDQFDEYMFVTNLQGDVIYIYNTAGNRVVSYTYDAWGRPTSITDTSGKSIGTLNPFRYRGYYYDTETGWYYLNSRYYDPQVRRFISPDNISYLGANGFCLSSFNLFSYCYNNPIINADYSGEIPFLIAAAVLLFTPAGGFLAQTIVSTVSYAGMAIASIWDEDIRQDMNAIGWNPFNADENDVINSNKVSFYKGAPVFRTNLDRSGSYYAIFLDGNASTSDVKHERGHNCQAMCMGIATYGLMIGLPSAFEWSERSYYERPWEITADIFGGVDRSHSAQDIFRGYCYLAVSNIFGPLGYLFLFGEY